jgi:hypothetical protein
LFGLKNFFRYINEKKKKPLYPLFHSPFSKIGALVLLILCLSYGNLLILLRRSNRCRQDNL